MRKTIKNLTLLAIAFSTSTIYASSFEDEFSELGKCKKRQQFEFEKEISQRKKHHDDGFLTQVIRIYPDRILYEQAYNESKIEITFVEGCATKIKTYNPDKYPKIDTAIDYAFKLVALVESENRKSMYNFCHKNEHHCNEHNNISKNDISISKNNVSQFTVENLLLVPRK